MRYAGIVFSVLLLSMGSSLSHASVLLPNNTPPLDSRPTSPKPTSPASAPPAAQSTATQPTAPALEEAVVAPVTAPSAGTTAPTAQPVLDEVNQEILSSLSSSEAQNSLPSSMKNLSQEDYKNILTGQSSPSLMQKIKDMGGALSAGTSLAVTGPITITPGGKLGKAPTSKKDLMSAKLLEMGIVVNENARVSPEVQKARDYAAQARLKHARKPIYVNNYELGEAAASTYTKPFLIGVLPDYTWGEGDVEAIHEALGYEREDIPKKCQVRLRIKMDTSDSYSAYNLYLSSGEQKTGSYNGTLNTLSTESVAVCYPPPTEANTGVVVLKHGDKHAIQLGSGSCVVPVRKNKNEIYEPTSAGIRYTGDGKIACGFR